MHRSKVYYNQLQGSKYYFEAMYNCNITLKNLVDNMILKGNRLGKEISELIEYIKALDMPEIVAIWM